MIDDDLVLRRADFELDDEQEALQESFRAFFQRECPTERVRVAANQSAAANIGSAPLAWWDVADTDEARAVLATGARAHEYFDDAVREWKLLVAGALLGVIGATLALSVEHAKNRQAFGVPIG